MRRHVAVLPRCARGLREYSSKPRIHRLWAAEDFVHRSQVLERYYEGSGLEKRARYPRISGETIDARQYFDAAKAGIAEEGQTFNVTGRVAKVRILGSKLVFADLETAGTQIQVECSLKATTGGDDPKNGNWDLFRKTIGVGDHWCRYHVI
jgi:lysyl-tRNA synthetase class II